MAEIPDDYRDLVQPPNFATVATVLPDGLPHQTVTWVDADGDHVLVNTADGRRKVKNVRRNPKVGVNVIDRDDTGRYLSVAGEVVEITPEGAADHANELGRIYYGEDDFMSRYGDDAVRLILRIEPRHVITH